MLSVKQHYHVVRNQGVSWFLIISNHSGAPRCSLIRQKYDPSAGPHWDDGGANVALPLMGFQTATRNTTLAHDDGVASPISWLRPYWEPGRGFWFACPGLLSQPVPPPPAYRRFRMIWTRHSGRQGWDDACNGTNFHSQTAADLESGSGAFKSSKAIR